MTEYKNDLFSLPLTYKRLEEICSGLSAHCPSLCVSTLAYSVCGRRIPYLCIGKGRRTVLYVAGHHASEWICGLPLLAFAGELCAIGGRGSAAKIGGENNAENTAENTAKDVARPFAAGEGRSHGALPEREAVSHSPAPGQDPFCTPRLLEQYRFLIVPQLNPDGTALQQNGPDPAHLLYRRQMTMNGGDPDFTHWQANARGVDLNHNYSVGFCEYRQLEAERGILGGAPSLYSGAYPESEPETASLANLVRLLRPSLILTLHTQGEEIFFDAPHATPAMHRMAEGLAALTGYRPAVAASTAAYGGLTDWAVRCGIPSFTLECGKGENPLPLSDAPDIYRRLRPALFCAPQLSYL